MGSVISSLPLDRTVPDSLRGAALNGDPCRRSRDKILPTLAVGTNYYTGDDVTEPGGTADRPDAADMDRRRTSSSAKPQSSCAGHSQQQQQRVEMCDEDRYVPLVRDCTDHRCQTRQERLAAKSI